MEIRAEIKTDQEEAERLLGDAPDLNGYKRNMRELAPWLDRYDAAIDRIETAIRSALSDSTVNSASERQQMEKVIELWDLRKRQSGLRRTQAKVILGYTPNLQAAEEFKTQLDLIDSDINGLEHKAAKIAAELQKK